MERIIQFRPIQKMSFDEFFNLVTDTAPCQYCDSYEECAEVMGYDNIDSISGNGCAAFDNTVENLKKFYLLEQCVIKT